MITATAMRYRAGTERLDLAVERALERVRNFLQADRFALLPVSVGQEAVDVRLASYAEGVRACLEEVNLAQIFPWSRQKLPSRARLFAPPGWPMARAEVAQKKALWD